MRRVRLLHTVACLVVGAAVLPFGPFTRTHASAAGDAGADVARAFYELHMIFFSQETGLATVIDPQVFKSSPGTHAAVGPQGIYHVAGIAPVHMNDPANTELLDADGAATGVSLGQREAARGAATLVCRTPMQTQLVDSRFRNLLPGGVYSVFIVHLTVQGPGRFTPLGVPDGNDNSFTADPAGTGGRPVVTSPCLTSAEAVVLVWHSDGQTHGASIGTPGRTSHNQLIFRAP